MKLFTAILLVLLSAAAQAQIKCPTYTGEQINRIHAAYDYGSKYGYELTLPAIVIQESFVGNRIIRYNPEDPSTGITQIEFRTLQHLSGLNRWDAATEAARLIADDELSFYYAIKKLDSINTTSYWYKWKRYNGSGNRAKAYANSIRHLTRQLQFCLNLQPIR